MVYRFETLREHVELNRYFLNCYMGCEVPMVYALKDLLTDPLKASYLYESGYEFPDKLNRCATCGKIYVTGKNGKEFVAGPDKTIDEEPYDTTFGDINIDFYYSHEGGELEHVKKTIILSGFECYGCLTEKESIKRGSVRLAIEDPIKWAGHWFYPRAFIGKPEGAEYVPLRKFLPAPGKA